MSASRHVQCAGRRCLAERTGRSSGHSTTIHNSLLFNGLRNDIATGVLALPLPWEGVRHDSGSSMKHLAVLIAGLAVFAAVLEAQGSPAGVPDSHRPPPGMCRIWIEGVPPAHQPAPTDCATAIRKRPVNAHVVFGSEPAGVERGFAPSHATPAPTPNPSVAPINQAHEEQDRQRAAQQHVDEEKRTRRDPPPTQHESHPNNAPQSHPRTEKSPSRPPSHSFSTRRPR